MLSSLHARAAAAPTWLRGLPSSRPRHLLPALCGAVLLGAGTTCALAVLRLRGAAAQGLPDLPASSALVIALAALVGLSASGARVGPRAAGLLAGTSAAGAVVLALFSEWVLAARLETPGSFVLAMAVPALLIGLTIGFAARAHRARGPMLALLLVAAGAASWLAPYLLAQQGLAAGLRIAAVLVLAGGALLAVRGHPPELQPDAPGGFGFGCLLAASLGFTAPLLLDAARKAGTAPGTGAGCLLAGLGVGTAIALALRWHERANGVWPALLLLPVLAAGAFQGGSSTTGSCLALALLGLLTGPVLLTALGPAGARAGSALAAGLGLVVLGRLVPVPPTWLAPLAALSGALALLRLSWLPMPALAMGLVVLVLLPRGHDASAIATVVDGSVHYRRSDQGIELRWRGRPVDVAGPDHRHGELLAHLGRLLQPAARRTAVLGIGTGRAATALAGWPEAGPVQLVCHRQGAMDLWTALQNDGPVAPRPRPFVLPSGMQLQTLGVRAFLTALPPASLDLALMPEPIGSEPWLFSEECHALLRTRLGRGLLLQTFRCDAVRLPLLRAAMASAAAVHPWCGLFLVGETGVLMAAGRAPDLAAAGRLLVQGPQSLRWQLHRTGLGAGCDLQLCFLGEVDGAGRAPLTDDGLAVHELPADAASVQAVAAELRAAIKDGALSQAGRLRLGLRAGSATERTEALRGLAALRCEHADSVLLRVEELRFAMADAVEAIARLDPADPGAPARGAARAAAWLHMGCPAPVLQAALALPDRLGNRLQEEARAAALATALDPTLAVDPPGILASILQGAPRQSPLEDFAVLPGDGDLWRLCTGPEPQAVALRARFPSDCARALVQRWQEGPLGEPMLSSLRELADPFVIEAASLAIGRQRRRELLALWRGDLPLPPALAELVRGDTAERLLMAQALPARRDRSSLLALADLLADPEYEVRLPAAAALVRSLGERVAYDPEWPASRLRQAAEQVRALHNRTP